MTTFPAGEQTHRAVLPQQPALESVRADTLGSKDETAHGLPATVRGTGGEHGRGETGGHGVRPRRRHVESAAEAAETAENGSGDAPTSPRYTGGIGASRVFVLARDRRPLMPCHPARARELLSNGRAVVHRQVPFTIRLRDRTRADSEVDGVQLRIDPGSKGTGIALTDEKTETDERGEAVLVRRGLVTAELQHRGDQIRHCMRQRAGYRRRRRSANLRHRAPRSNNRTRPEGWLAPSLRHRVDTTISLAHRFCRYAPVTEVHVESVAFDTHSMSAGKQLKGAEYGNGTLVGTDARAFLLAVRGRACAYCGATSVPLNLDHIHPSSRGGSSRISNLVLACVPCNQAKGSKPVAVFLADRPERLAEILAQTRPPLRDAAVMNSTRRRLIEALGVLGPPVHAWPGVRTQQNRTAMGLDKTHTADALAIGELDRESGGRIVRVPARVLVVKATGRGSYARTTPDRFGFPRLQRARIKQHFGYITGDLVRATLPTGKWAGTWSGRVSVRARGQHSLTTPTGRINVSHMNLRLLQRGDGYAYDTRQESVLLPGRKTG
ncbi:RNA-guided endonuclease IscB [Streptomyces sp. NPDC048441]|uniref:RNA-guided endonuclease IscB n=1 Tax=Streptomyces sp. NPDC048441 TaxID=3365552 RepID=UPI00371CEE3D